MNDQIVQASHYYYNWAELYTTITYSLYLLLSYFITVKVGKTLNKNGRVFLVHNLNDEGLADSVNHLLLVGFYLVNAGFVTLALKYGAKPYSTQTAIEFLSTKIGLAIVVLGGMHFFNMYVLSRFKRCI